MRHEVERKVEMIKIGERVGALLRATKDEVEVLGYGVYEGDDVPDDAAGGMASLVRAAGIKNPKIRLDSGKVVWGCECWWGSEEETKKRVAQYPSVVEVDIDEVRAKAREE